MSVSSGSDGKRLAVSDVTLATSRATIEASPSTSSLHRKRPLLRSRAKTHSDSVATKTRSSTTSRDRFYKTPFRPKHFRTRFFS
jgi:hypothetical protein